MIEDIDKIINLNTQRGSYQDLIIHSDKYSHN